jgi:hypothetical protein
MGNDKQTANAGGTERPTFWRAGRGRTIGEDEHVNDRSDPPFSDHVCVQRTVPASKHSASGYPLARTSEAPNGPGGLCHAAVHATRCPGGPGQAGWGRSLQSRRLRFRGGAAHVDLVRSSSGESRSMSEHTRTYACAYQKSVLWSISASCQNKQKAASSGTGRLPPGPAPQRRDAPRPAPPRPAPPHPATTREAWLNAMLSLVVHPCLGSYASRSAPAGRPPTR